VVEDPEFSERMTEIQALIQEYVLYIVEVMALPGPGLAPPPLP
jgi:hypothetical protein